MQSENAGGEERVEIIWSLDLVLWLVGGEPEGDDGTKSESQCR